MIIHGLQCFAAEKCDGRSSEQRSLGRNIVEDFNCCEILNVSTSIIVFAFELERLRHANSCTPNTKVQDGISEQVDGDSRAGDGRGVEWLLFGPAAARPVSHALALAKKESSDMR